MLNAPFEFYVVTPFPEGVFGSFGNGLYFVVLAVIGASLLYSLLKRKSHRLISLITGFALTAAAFLLAFVYLFVALLMLNISYADILALILAIPLTALIDFAVFRTDGRGYSLAVLFLGGALGAFLAMSIPTWSAVLVLSLLAVYDVFAVYRGPVGKIASTGLEKLRGLSLSFRDVQIGLGDLTFYSMLTSLVFADAGTFFCVISMIGVLVGAFLALKMLEKKGMFPGLPFSVAFGLAPLLVWLLL